MSHGERERASMTEVEAIQERIPWDPDPSKVDCNRVLHDHSFPSLSGKAKVRDDFLRRQSKNPHVGNPQKVRVERDNIRFHREDTDDPDELVSTLLYSNICYHFFLSNLISLHKRVIILQKCCGRQRVEMLFEVDELVAIHGLAPLNHALSSSSAWGCIPLSSSGRMFNTSP